MIKRLVVLFAFLGLLLGGLTMGAILLARKNA